MIIVDASALIAVLLETPQAADVRKRMSMAETVGAPHLIDAEILHVLRRYVAIGQVNPRQAGEAVAAFRELPVMRFPHGPLLDRVWDLRNNLTAYDALYVALAETLGVPLLTADRRIANAPGHAARIELA